MSGLKLIIRTNTREVEGDGHFFFGEFFRPEVALPPASRFYGSPIYTLITETRI